MRLNLGCGDKLLDGYINVDLVDQRLGKRPDVICDIKKLDLFSDNTADEILAVHVIEHFYRWEVVDLLKRWYAVLKPDGVLIVETPNLISACEALLKDPLHASGPGKEGQMSMWPLYGDPGWKDPMMIHKWLYTPQSLAAVLNEAGYTNIKRSAAQFKMREPRDMRLKAYKSSAVH